MNNGFILSQDGSLTVYTNNQQNTIAKTHANYNKIKEKLKAKDYEGINELIDVKATIANSFDGQITIDGINVVYNGKVLHNAVCKKILQFVSEGFDTKPLLNFLAKLMKNPSMRSVDTLYEFLERHDMVITDDGDFLAFKSLRNDYYDWHSGTICSPVGSVIKMPRNEISDDFRIGCHKGLHIGAMDYVKTFNPGGKIVVVKASPENVVCVPEDCEFKKIRVCEYEVVEDYNLQNAPKQKLAEVPVDSDEDCDYCDCEYDEECDDCEYDIDDCHCNEEDDFDDDEEDEDCGDPNCDICH